MAQVTMKEMLDAGVHFGHQTQRWNPKMKPYVFTARGGIHIIDLQKTVVRANQAADFVKEIAASGGAEGPYHLKMINWFEISNLVFAIDDDSQSWCLHAPHIHRLVGSGLGAAQI